MDIPKTVRDLRIMVAAMATRADHVFDRVITTSSTPMPKPMIELSLVAHAGSFHGYALAAVLHEVEAVNPALAEKLVHIVNDVGANGDDSRSADIWPDIQRELATGGVGTRQWDEQA